jgi:hypothetical protein
MKPGKTILLIADEIMQRRYERIFAPKQIAPSEHNLITIFEEWENNPDLYLDQRVEGHSGPLCNGFMEALIEKVGPEKYQLAVVDLLCADLISPMKHAGYTGKALVIGTPITVLPVRYPYQTVGFGEYFPNRLHRAINNSL